MASPLARPALLVRVSSLLFALYAPFVWLVWFSDSPDYRRHLLLLWVAFPIAVPTDMAWGVMTGSRLEDPALSWAIVPITALLVGTALALMRRSWPWLIGTALAIAALASVVSFGLSHLVRA
jgi:hypothetical protein